MSILRIYSNLKAVKNNLNDIDITELLDNPEFISTDTRNLMDKKYFICFSGKNFDSHDFVDELIKNDIIKYVFIDKDLNLDSEKLVKVDNCLDFYHSLANSYRKKVNPKLIAITGSAGKTTTKNLLTKVLSSNFKTHATEANFNNEYGVPKTILSMPQNTEVLICEMGMRGLGQIDYLTKTAEPNFAGITNIGSAHIEILGSKEKIRQAKLEIISGFNPENESNTLYLDKELTDFVCNSDYYMGFLSEKNVEIKTFDSFYYESSPQFLISEGLLADMDLVRLISKDLGVSDHSIKEALEAYLPDKGRGNFIFKDELNGKKNILFIDETYNSNIEAVKNSVDAIKQIFPQDKKIIVLGEIRESDELEVEMLFRDLNKDSSLNLVDARHFEHFESKMIIENLLTDNSVVFFKASRSEKLEELIELFD